jgi:hypothetical protein
MVTFLFLAFARSVFVPYLLGEYRENLELPVVTKDELDALVASNGRVIAFGFSRKEYHAKALRIALAEFSKHYSEDGVFVILRRADAKGEAVEHNLKLPVVFVYSQGSLLCVYPYLNNEAGFARILELIFHGSEHDSEIALSKQDVYRLLGDLNLVLLAPTPELYFHAVKIHLNASERVGEIGVFRVAPHVLVEFGLSPDRLAMWRQDDSQIVSFDSMNESFVADLDAFHEASRPVYRRFQAIDFADLSAQFMILTGPPLTPDSEDLLFDLGTKYPEYTFGYLKAEFLPLISHVLGVEVRDRLGFHVCSFMGRWRIEFDDIFDLEFLRRPFNQAAWMARIELAIAEVRKGRRRLYLSEPVPVPIAGSLIKKVVGRTYETFVMDPHHDVLMLYVHENCKPWKEFKDTYIEFVKEFFATWRTFLKFGWIDVQQNSVEMGWPTMRSMPHFELWPAKNKTDHDQMRGSKSRDDLVRFLSPRCMEPFPLSAPEPDRFQTSVRLINMLMNQPMDLSEQEFPKYLRHLCEIADSIGVDLNQAPGFEEFANKLPANQARALARSRMAQEAIDAEKDAEQIRRSLEL